MSDFSYFFSNIKYTRIIYSYIYNNIIYITIKFLWVLKLFLNNWNLTFLTCLTTWTVWKKPNNLTVIRLKLQYFRWISHLHTTTKRDTANIRRFLKTSKSFAKKIKSFLKKLFLRLSQVPYNGFYLMLQEGVAARIVAHLCQFLTKRGATVYPTIEGFQCTILSGVRTVKQSQIGLWVKTDIKHDKELWIVNYEWVTVTV